jgi:3-oxoadipate enol-lactonase
MTPSRRTLLAALSLAALLPSGFVTAQAADRPSAPKTTAWAKANGVFLRYELSGAGPRTVVLLHEMTTTMESWDVIAPALARHYRVLRYDLRGFGLSERIRGEITLADEVEDLRALLAALGLKGKVTLIGGAIGGAIALLYAATYPDEVEGVVAISPAASLTPQLDRLKASADPNQPGPASNVRAPGADDPAYPLVLQKAHPDRYAKYLAITASGASGGAPSTRAVYSFGFADVLPKIRCPVTIVATTMWMRSFASFKELSDAIPRGRIVPVETGHFATIAAPELVIPILNDFLTKTSPRSGRDPHR